jgi:hypothetical protein
MNAVVLHMKDPYGRIFWRSNNLLAIETGAVSDNYFTNDRVAYLKKNNIRTIAKIDVFLDNRLVQSKPVHGVRNAATGELWTDYSGMYWANPYDKAVWDYNIDLCRELAGLGFDEIQFDYVRFPSDGDLKALRYPLKQKGVGMSQCIGGFLEKAWTELKPLGVSLSVDVFGLTAWKQSDFGVGQVIEDISPYVDIICPMFYPSHFPKGFLGLQNPADFPKLIMDKSTRMMQKRTSKIIRPWIQGFWYSPLQISLQIEAVENTGTGDWMVWNSTGDYEKTNLALTGFSKNIPKPVFYPDLNELKSLKEKIIYANKIIVNYTNYEKGFTILSLEKSDGKGEPSRYLTPVSVIQTMDEAIIDLLLQKNHATYNTESGKYPKCLTLAEILCRQLNTSPRKFRQQPVYVDWGGAGTFSFELPDDISKIK